MITKNVGREGGFFAPCQLSENGYLVLTDWDVIDILKGYEWQFTVLFRR